MLLTFFSGSVYTRRFVWDFYPAGFFPRLLVRLMHLQLMVPISWANAAVLFSRVGDEVTFLEIKQETHKFILEVLLFFVFASFWFHFANYCDNRLQCIQISKDYYLVILLQL